MNKTLTYRYDGEKVRITMKELTLTLTHTEISETLAPLYRKYNRDSRNAYETRRDYPETLYNAVKNIDVAMCEARMRDFKNSIVRIERMFIRTCGVEFHHEDHFHPCHEYEKVSMSLHGISYPLFNAETDSK